MNFTDIRWIVDYDYRRTPCHCYEDICRCTRIIDAEITTINEHAVIDKLKSVHVPKDASFIDDYCFDRLCHFYKIYDKYNYDITTCGGYYGEEIDEVHFSNEKELATDFIAASHSGTPLDKIKFMLKKEYGFVLPVIDSCTKAEIVTVKRDLIIVPQESYARKLEPSVLDYYKNHTGPVGVVIKKDNGYRLIDGYHRYASSSSDTVQVVVLS